MSFNLETKGSCSIITSEDDLVGPKAEEFGKYLDTALISIKTPAVVIDLKGMTEIDRNFLRVITPVAKQIKDFGKRLFVIQPSSSATTFLKGSGLDNLLTLFDTLQEVTALYAQSMKFDVGFVNTFIDATLKTLKIQASVDAKSAKPFVKKEGQQMATELAAVIGLTSKAFNGSIAICFPASVFLAIMSNMLGEKFEVITKELEDGAAELLNIIFGQAKRTLNERGYAVDKAIPTIVRGQALQVHHLTLSATIVVPFETSSGSFHIEIATESS